MYNVVVSPRLYRAGLVIKRVLSFTGAPHFIWQFTGLDVYKIKPEVGVFSIKPSVAAADKTTREIEISIIFFRAAVITPTIVARFDSKYRAENDIATYELPIT